MSLKVLEMLLNYIPVNHQTNILLPHNLLHSEKILDTSFYTLTILNASLKHYWNWSAGSKKSILTPVASKLHIFK